MSRAHCRRGRRRLFWRVYLHGLLLLVVVAAAVSTAALFSEPDPRWHWGPVEALRLVAADLARSQADPGALQEVLDRLHRVTARDVAVYRADGARVAAAGEDPPPAPALSNVEDVDAASSPRRGLGQVAVWIGPDRAAYVVLAAPEHRGGRFVATVVVILAALALGSVPLARAIARPLERLTATSRVLAAGDLTARSGIRRRDEVGELATAIDEMAARLEARVRAEKEMLANVSHELRTPLARIRVALELCTEEGADLEDVRRHLGGIAEDVAELDALVGDVLATARLDLRDPAAAGGGLLREAETVSVVAWLRSAAERFGALYPEHRLRTEWGADLGALHGDPVLLRRLIDNLLENAAKHSPAEEPIVLRARRDQGLCTIEVADHGLGVADSDLPRLFEPFFRTRSSREREVRGVGLGLTLCRRIAEAHGGTIAAAHNPPRGLLVRVEVPVEEGEAQG